MGIPREDLPRIFERFYRVDKGTSQKLGGTGLGLSIVKHIIQAQGGRVWAESEFGQGSTFYFIPPKEKKSSQRYLKFVRLVILNSFQGLTLCTKRDTEPILKQVQHMVQHDIF